MFIQGMAGVSRRWYDGGASYDIAQGVLHWNSFMSISAWLLGLSQLIFIFNIFWSKFAGKKASDNPWDATTLDWTATATPPQHGNFKTAPVVYHGPYDYSMPGAKKDFTPQNQHVEA